MWRIGLFWIICHLAVAAPLVDINAASAQEIAEGLVGIGVKKAQAIVAYRDQVGQILTIEELLVVKGIGEKTLARNRDRIRTVLMDGDAVRTRDPSDRLVQTISVARQSRPATAAAVSLQVLCHLLGW